MPLNTLKKLHKDETGSAGMEMVLVLPLYAMMIYSVFTLGDLVFQAEKCQAAAGYCAFNRDTVSAESVKAMFFYRGGSRITVDLVTDPQRSSSSWDTSYPHPQAPAWPFSEANASTMIKYRSLKKAGVDTVTETGNNEKSVVTKILGKAFEGSQTIPHFFGVVNPLVDREGGGWVVQRKSSVNMNYKQMFPFKNTWKLHGFCVTLAGFEYGSNCEGQSTNGEAWDFRDERAWNYYKPIKDKDGNIAPLRVALSYQYTNSGWNCALFSELEPKPASPFKFEKDPTFLIPPILDFKQPWAEMSYGDFDGFMGMHKVE